jgi:orotate phosphoribosyltransferase
LESQSLPERWSKYILWIKGGRPFGNDGRIRAHFFLDLLSAAHNVNELREMSTLLSRRIRETQDMTSLTLVATPKNGNTLLGHKVGVALEKNTVFARNSMIFSKWIEGVAMVGDRAILVDDVASDGEMLRDAVRNLRSAGIYTQALYVLVDRKEGDTFAVCKEEAVKYNYLFQVDDALLEQLYRRAHQ